MQERRGIMKQMAEATEKSEEQEAKHRSYYYI